MKSTFYPICAAALLSLLISAQGEVGREAGRSTTFVGRLEPSADSKGQCEFSVEIERVMFALNSLKDKYKVVRIRVANGRGTPIMLSDQDTIELEQDDGTVVRGTFILNGLDAELWKSFGVEKRTALAYPLSVKPAKVDEVPFQSEVVYVFAFFPADKFPAEKMPELPRSFRYTIQSVGKTVKMERPPAVAN